MPQQHKNPPGLHSARCLGEPVCRQLWQLHPTGTTALWLHTASYVFMLGIPRPKHLQKNDSTSAIQKEFKGPFHFLI